MKPRVKVLVAVWGSSYIDAFTALALPSLLAPGNLPALAEATDLEVCILTSKNDRAVFETKSAFQTLRSLCRVGFIGIDDLLGSTVYGITLTLAYMRGIAAEGDDMVNVHFMFFNSDFILAEGSLRSLLAQIVAGRRVVMAPSFRANAEEIEPLLQAKVDASRQTLSVPARQLVGLALRHLHPTIVAKTMNQAVFRSLYHNQLYWRVDDNTIVGRFYLMFMLCIRPERVVRTANTYCDYGFVPELVPSLDVAFLTDSDAFFMLETQARRHESVHMRLGPHRLADIAGYLSEWTTREHRRCAAQDLVFHAAEIPSALQGCLADANAAVQRLEALLPPARSHAYHPYWVGSLPLWRKHLAQRGLGANPAELEAIAEAPTRQTWLGRLFGVARRIARGARDELRPWHAGWLDQRLIERLLAETRGASSVLIVADAMPPAAGRPNTSRISLQESLNNTRGTRYERVLAFLRPDQLTAHSGALASRLLNLVAEGGQLELVVHDPDGEFATAALAEPLLDLLTDAATACRMDASIRFSDGGVQRRVRLAVRRLAHLYVRRGLVWLPMLAVGGAALLAANALNHAWRLMRGESAEQPAYSGSMVVRIRKLEALAL